MKQIRLKDQIKIIKFCNANSCPCYECFIDTGEGMGEPRASCNLGASIKIDDMGWPVKDGVFPDDCPLEEEAGPSKELTDKERTRILKFIEENKQNIIDVPTIEQQYTAEPRESGYIESVPVDEVKVIIRMRLPLTKK